MLISSQPVSWMNNETIGALVEFRVDGECFDAYLLVRVGGWCRPSCHAATLPIFNLQSKRADFIKLPPLKNSVCGALHHFHPQKDSFLH